MTKRFTGILELPFAADGAITKFRFVKQNSEEGVVICSVAGEKPIGVFQVDVSADEVTKGKGGAVQILGVSLVEAGAAIAIGALITTDTTGRGVTAAGTDAVAGIALNAAAAAGEWVGVLLTP